MKSDCENCNHPDHGLDDYLRERMQSTVSLRNCNAGAKGAPCRCREDILEAEGDARAAERLAALRPTRLHRRMRDPQVQGYCPMGCGKSLFLGNGGFVTCGNLECPDPEAVTKLIEDPPETAHTVLFADDDTFTIQHPITERLTGLELFICALHTYLVGLEGPPVVPGRYRVTPASRGWQFTKIDKITETEKEHG